MPLRPLLLALGLALLPGCLLVDSGPRWRHGHGHAGGAHPDDGLPPGAEPGDGGVDDDPGGRPSAEECEALEAELRAGQEELSVAREALGARAEQAAAALDATLAQAEQAWQEGHAAADATLAGTLSRLASEDAAAMEALRLAYEAALAAGRFEEAALAFGAWMEAEEALAQAEADAWETWAATVARLDEEWASVQAEVEAARVALEEEVAQAAQALEAQEQELQVLAEEVWACWEALEGEGR
jgi:hypothetical protein